MTREELIVRLEAATEPDRLLDAEIAVAMPHDGQWRVDTERPGEIRYHLITGPKSASAGTHDAPPFTSSVDWAVKAIPAGFEHWAMLPCEGEEGALNGPFNGRWDACIYPGTLWCNGATPAIALCIAMLHKRGLQP